MFGRSTQEANRHWVATCYRAILGREPDEGGLETFARMMTIDGHGQGVIRALLDSREYRMQHGRVLGLHRCFDFQMLIPENDWMLEGIVHSGTYEPYVIEAFTEACRGARVLDVGANIGVFSCAAALVTDKTVTAVEVLPENVRLLRINADLNMFNNIEILPVAATQDMGPVTVTSHNSNGVVRDLPAGADSYGTFDMVWGMPLDRVVADKIDVFKIDVEGLEYAALQGATRIMDGRPTMFVEFSPEFMERGCGVSPNTFMAFFFDRGYEASILHRDMTREAVGRDIERLTEAWRGYMDRNITHLDLMLTAHN